MSVNNVKEWLLLGYSDPSKHQDVYHHISMDIEEAKALVSLEKLEMHLLGKSPSHQYFMTWNYDTTWQYDIGLQGMGFQNRMFKGRVNNNCYSVHQQHKGVHEGIVLCTTCFVLASNGISHVFPPHVRYSIYVDDLIVSYVLKELLRMLHKILLMVQLSGPLNTGMHLKTLILILNPSL